MSATRPHAELDYFRGWGLDGHQDRDDVRSRATEGRAVTIADISAPPFRFTTGSNLPSAASLNMVAQLVRSSSVRVTMK